MVGNFTIDKVKRWLNQPKQWLTHRTTMLAVGTVLVGVIFLLLLSKVPEWQTPAGVTEFERAQLQNESRKTVAQIALGLLVLGSLFVGWRRVRAADQTVEVARDQQITERFTRAIEQLGNEQSIAIRLRGIYALERIAKDSPKDHWQVMEVLTAYIRENARWDGEVDENGVPVPNPSENHLIHTDIQAILTVLGRREVDQDPDRQLLDLQSTDLRGADLGGADLKNANLSFACLCGIEFRDADVQRASFLGCNLKGARLSNAKLTETILAYAELVCADLTRANIRGALFYNADLQDADLAGADLAEARNLTQEQIDSAIIDEQTILPDYLKQE